jgi:hypothetical protein
MLGVLGIFHITQVKMYGGRKKIPKGRIVNDIIRSHDMINTIWGIIFFVMGLLFVIFSRRIARDTAKFHNMHDRFSEKVYRIGFLLGGVVFAIFGLLTVFQIIKMKK